MQQVREQGGAAEQQGLFDDGKRFVEHEVDDEWFAEKPAATTDGLAPALPPLPPVATFADVKRACELARREGVEMDLLTGEKRQPSPRNPRLTSLTIHHAQRRRAAGRWSASRWMGAQAAAAAAAAATTSTLRDCPTTRGS